MAISLLHFHRNRTVSGFCVSVGVFKGCMLSVCLSLFLSLPLSLTLTKEQFTASQYTTGVQTTTRSDSPVVQCKEKYSSTIGDKEQSRGPVILPAGPAPLSLASVQCPDGSVHSPLTTQGLSSNCCRPALRLVTGDGGTGSRQLLLPPRSVVDYPELRPD